MHVTRRLVYVAAITGLQSVITVQLMVFPTTSDAYVLHARFGCLDVR